MTRRVRIAAAFRKDLRAQLLWLSQVDEAEWIEGLRDGVDEAIELLSQHPGVGSLEAKAGASELRRIVLRRVPYVVWYGAGRSAHRDDVWLLRLFHVRQRQPRPTWPPAPAPQPRGHRSR